MFAVIFQIIELKKSIYIVAAFFSLYIDLEAFLKLKVNMNNNLIFPVSINTFNN